jgi:hypothetical protein
MSNVNELAVEFFYEHAGWGYDPETETSEQGRERCARELAEAEQWAIEQGMYFEIQDDDDADPYDWDGEGPMGNYALIVTLMVPCKGCGGATAQGSLGGIWMWNSGEGDEYVRVVQAQLADEYRSSLAAA